MTTYCADIESTGLLHHLEEQGSDAKLHNFGCRDLNGNEFLFTHGWNVLNRVPCKDIRPLEELQAFLDEGPTLIMHNGITYDGEALIFFGYDISKCRILDTLYMAWYLEPLRNRYGLAYYGEEFGTPKPTIEDWINLSQEEYNFRVMQDCRIQHKLWKKLWNMMLKLYENDKKMSLKMVEYLMSKGRHLRRAQRTKWKIDVAGCEKFSAELHEDRDTRFDILVDIMPRTPIYKTKSRPKKCFKINGELGGWGPKWLLFCLKYGVDFTSHKEYTFQDGDEIANPNSPTQKKDWLFSMGWVPETFVYKKNEDGSERAIPQVNVPDSGGQLDPGIERMVEDYEDLVQFKGLGIINHRIGIVDGWLRDNVDGYIIARAAGFTNTLRLRHGGVVNVPSPRVLHGARLRGLLVAEEGYVSLGSDLSGLEDRCKHHFQIPIDPEYVEQQLDPEFDPHMTIAVLGQFVTQDDYDFYIEMDHDRLEKTEENVARFKRIKPMRNLGKRSNYGCQYGAYPPRLARDAKIPLETGQRLFDAYWKLNWSINDISAATEVKRCNGAKWQRNSINGFWYHLKTDKDRFSTLCQGSGSYVFDTWLEEIFKICDERYGREPELNGQFHDEIILKCKAGTEHIWTEIVETAIERANVILKMRRDMAIDTQIGTDYSQIH